MNDTEAVQMNAPDTMGRIQDLSRAGQGAECNNGSIPILQQTIGSKWKKEEEQFVRSHVILIRPTSVENREDKGIKI